MESIFDIGMFDASDTEYYLELGYRVVAIEANPALAEHATMRFPKEVSSGQLTCLNRVITSDGSPGKLVLSATDLGSSSIFGARVENKRPVGSVTVAGTTISHLLQEYGTPKFIKVDIEGADRYCILPLTSADRPAYLSFEIGDDVDELLCHAESIGYRAFKIINQNTFRESENEGCLQDRVVRKIAYLMGYAEPFKIRRAGRFFVCGHSSGPVPWQSDGRWRPIEEIRASLRQGTLLGWNDIHATAGNPPS